MVYSSRRGLYVPMTQIATPTYSLPSVSNTQIPLLGPFLDMARGLLYVAVTDRAGSTCVLGFVLGTVKNLCGPVLNTMRSLVYLQDPSHQERNLLEEPSISWCGEKVCTSPRPTEL